MPGQPASGKPSQPAFRMAEPPAPSRVGPETAVW